jgi:hypothetical protein
MHRSGVARWDVLIVMLIVFTIGGLVVVGVQRAREKEATRMTHDNLRQCALGIHSFHDNYKKLPNAIGPGGFWSKNHSFWSHLRMFVEMSNFISIPKLDEVIPAYLSPADPSHLNGAGALSFAANLRVFGHATFRNSKQPVDQPGHPLEIPEGIIASGLSLGTIADGAESTIMLTTRYSMCAGERTLWAAHPRGGGPVDGQGGFMGAGSHDTPASHNGPITAMFQAAPSQAECLPQPGVFGHSFTRKGLSVALCDGSVRVIAPSMSPTTFGRALCPGDGAKLGDDWEAD